MTIARGVVVAHYREIGLKGKNRSFFERRLAGNIRTVLSGVPGAAVAVISGRILIRPVDESQTPAVLSRLGSVFGLSGFSPAMELTRPSMQDLCSAAIEMASDASFETFRVRARRGNTSFPQTSGEINVAVGQALKDATGAAVDLGGAEWTCHIEVVGDRAYLYTERLPGPGGLPVGSSGKVLALLSGGIDSPVAAWHMAKRGALVDFAHFHGQPYSDPSSARQAGRLARQLSAWLLRSRLWMVPFGETQAEIVTVAPERLRIVLYRRMMMRISEAIARSQGAQALVTGESLGQVASQTLPNMAAIDSVTSMPVLRPLVGFDKIEIEAVAGRIGTYEISIEPHQDCCVLFSPRRVTTAAKVDELEKAESALDIPSLVDKAVANAQVTDLQYP